jgi:hypothetical protein
MVSSNRFGGRGTTAGSRVQIGSTGETEPGAIFPAEQQARGSSEGKLLPHHVPDVDMRGPLQQRIEVGMVSRLGIAAEDRGVDIDVHVGPDLGETPAALALHHPAYGAAPEILSLAGFL